MQTFRNLGTPRSNLILSLLLGLTCLTASAEEDIAEEESLPPDLPPAFLTLGYRGGQGEAEGHGDFTLPVWHDPEIGMLLFDVRASFSDRDEEEMNLGFVFRKLLAEDRGIVGLNAYYDSRWTTGDTQWDQFGLGFEFLSIPIMDLFYDLRFNYYIPESGRELVDVTEDLQVSRSSSSSTVASTGPLSGIHAFGNQIGHTRTTTFTTRTTTRTTTSRFRFE
ncbi:MAG: inverse autotransporter beta domain-containing protein, partial [Verrucomicrobiota bacterium]